MYYKQTKQKHIYKNINLFVLEQTFEFGPGFGESRSIEGVDEEDDAVHGGEVVFPHATRWKNK